jgi:hypothetical protein
MPTERRRQLILAALVIVLLGVIYRLWTTTSPAPVAASNRSAGGAATARSQPPAGAGRGTGTAAADAAKGMESPDVHLEALNAERVRPGASERNLFRYKPKPPPPAPPPPPVQPTAPVNPVPQPPPGPPPLPPITLKFIGIIESPTHARKIAVLSDGRNPPFQGEEGAIIEGRYRILKIGVESIELAYVDGRGRQTIRLTGS